MNDDIKPLGHDFSPDDPDDVDWLWKWSNAAEREIHALEVEIRTLEAEIRRLRAEVNGLRAEAVLRR